MSDLEVAACVCVGMLVGGLFVVFMLWLMFLIVSGKLHAFVERLADGKVDRS